MWIFLTSTSFVLVHFWLIIHKKELDIKLKNAQSIKKQLEKAVELDFMEGKMHNGAVCFCKKVEQDILKQYNDLAQKPCYYITAKIFGYPIRLKAGN